MAELPGGTVTLVFTDIEGSTRLLESLGERYGEVLAEHRRLLREAFTAHGGVEVDTQGDAFFYVFPRAQDAAKAAMESQRVLASHPWPDNAEVRVRMGIHTGEPQTSSEGYVGPDVHRAARICAAAHGGQVLISQATKDLIEGTGLDRATLHDLGEHALKDISSRVHLYELEIDGLRSDFPPIRTLDAHPTNLPPSPTALVGREQEVTRLATFLQSDGTRLITLTGPGGTGKTRLALGVAHELLEDFSDGVFVVDLSPVTDASLVVAQIAAALSLRESGGRRLEETLHDYLASKEMLLVIDNFEQVMDAASEVASLLSSGPHVRVLVTSREPLRIAGEHEFAVAPLSLPSSSSPRLEDARRSPAVALFTERARGVRADFELTEDNVAAVIAICRRLDGLPLAIELAAARVKVLSPHGLLDRLDHSLKLLSSGRRDGSERQRTLRGAISWSYELLSEDEQKLFHRLGVFSGGWSLEAAEEVCDRGDLDLEVLNGLASLVDKSLVRTMTGDEERFSMLETIREFAIERLEESGEAQEIRRAHAEYFRGLAEDAEPHLVGEAQKEWLDRLEKEHDNLRFAMGSSLQREADSGLRIAASMRRFWWVRGYLSEGQMWLSQALDRSAEQPIALRARLVYASGFLAQAHGDNELGEHRCQTALELFRSIGDDAGAARALEILGAAAEERGDFTMARSYHEETLAAYEELDDSRGIAVAIGNLASVALKQGLLQETQALSKRSFELYQSLGMTEGVAACLVNIGLAALQQGALREAREALRDCLATATDLDHKELMTHSLIGLAAVASASTEFSEGARLLGAAQRLQDATGAVLPLVEKAVFDRTVEEIQANLAEEAFEAALVKGRTTDPKEILGVA